MSTPSQQPCLLWNRWEGKLVQLAIFSFGALSIAFPSGYSVGFIALFLLALTHIGSQRYWQELGSETRMLALLFMGYFVLNAIAILVDDGILKNLDRPSRLFALCLMLPLLCRYRPRLTMLLSGVGTGAIIAGAIALYDRLQLHMDRAFSDIMPIQSGNISLSLALVSLCALAWYYHKRAYLWSSFYAIATLFGIMGSLLSGSRGGWTLFPLLLVIWYLAFRHWFSRRFKLGLMITLVLGCSTLLLPQVGFMERIAETRSDIHGFTSNSNPDTSVGFRLQLWRSALQSFSEKPLLGWGPKGIRESQKQQYEAGTLSLSAYQFNSHAHNQYLDHMAKYGLVGLGMLLALFLLPWRLARQIARRHGKDSKNYMLAMAAILHIAAVMNYCLSQAFLNHNSGMIFYPFMLVLLLCCATDEKPAA